MTIRKILLVVAVAALLSAAHTASALPIDFAPTPKPGPALAARIAAGDCEVYGIVHWGLNTYTDREWGFGDENPEMLAPAHFDADQIVGACKAGGLGGLIVVAKHHDGFCLWPTKTTEHNITKTPFWRGTGTGDRGTGRDYVKEMEQACRRAGLKFGVYVSPWDRHDADYAKPEYVEKYHAQIKELLSGDYGEVFEMWFDGANGGDGWYGGAKERRRIGGDYYRFPEVFKFVRALQPKVCIFAGESDDSDLRWPGNEKGELDPNSCATICTVGGFADGKYGNPEYGRCINRGMRNFENTAGHPMFFRVCECDFPMRPGWFYHAKERGKTKSAAYLMQRYLNTVGNGGTMNIGIAPNKDGRLDEEDVKALKGFKTLKDAFFARHIDEGGRANVVVMTEDVSHGELVDGWSLVQEKKKWLWGVETKLLAEGRTIGIKRIRVLKEPVKTSEIKFRHGCPRDFFPGYSLRCRYYYADPELVSLIESATTESGETDTAKWMMAGKQGARDEGVAQRIAATKKVLRSDTWYGYKRTVFDFEGHEAWVVSPKCAPAAGLPWTWTMQWAEAYVDRTGVLDLLAKGWHHVTIDTFRHRMDDEGLRVSRAFQKFLVEELGFASKANLVGMSWGGFFSTRYAAAFPECVGKIYLDAPLMNFEGFAKVGGTPTENAAQIGPWANMPPTDGNWSADPRMPVNMADPLAKAGIPILLLYGGQDATVPPSRNCELFAERFKAAGGKIDIHHRALYGHHPHGEDPDKTSSIVSFFEGRQSSTTNF